MKVAHWTLMNGAGLANMAQEIAIAEQALGIENVLCDTSDPSTWEKGMGADIHVAHSHIPDELSLGRKAKFIAVEHGSPEHTFEISVNAGLTQNYNPGDSFSVMSFLLRKAVAVVTFWPRHAHIWETMTDRPIYCIPMGVDTNFWTRQVNVRMLNGSPCIFTAENCYSCKWPIDMILMWPHIMGRFPNARLHVAHLPMDQHRWWIPLSYMNGSHYTAYLNPHNLGKNKLREFLCSADFYYSPVQYGDFNRISLEAASCGAKIISFKGNEHAHFWITEGDQREQEKELLEILNGEREERQVSPVASIMSTAQAMLQVYKEVL